MAECVDGRFIGRRITQKRKERNHVFALVVGPYRRIENLAAGSVHISAPRSDDAFGSPEFGKMERRIQHRIGRFEHKAVSDVLPYERTARSQLRGDVRTSGIFTFAVCLKHRIESHRIAGCDLETSAARNIGPQDVTALHAFRRIGFERLHIFRDIDRTRAVRAAVAQHITLACQRQGPGRKNSPGHRHGRFGSIVRHQSQFRPPCSPRTAHLHHSIEPHLLHRFRLQGEAVHAQQ